MTQDNIDPSKDPNHLPPLHQAIPLGIQHVLAMFASNITPAIIVSLAAGFSFGSAEMVYMIQIHMKTRMQK
jgi:NCS2 family nucleobase:cation symporter-2